MKLAWNMSLLMAPVILMGLALTVEELAMWFAKRRRMA